MKKIKNYSVLVLLFVLLSLIIGCTVPQDDDDDPPAGITLPGEPEAIAANDNTQNGIYKGIIVGDDITGSYKLIINNTITTEAATARAGDATDDIVLQLYYNGTYVIITGTETQVETDYTYTFTNSTYTFTITISSTGSVNDSTGISLTVGGVEPDVSFNTLKEKSDSLVQAFEGTCSGSGTSTYGATTYTSSIDGVWNIIINNSQLKGSWKATVTTTGGGVTDTSEDAGIITGTQSNNTWSGSYRGSSSESENYPYSGTVSDNKVSGTWTQGDADTSGTFKGSRKF